MRYSASERFIAKLLSSFPQFKLFIKYVYQRFNFLRYKKSYQFKSSNKIIKISNDKSDNSFFGYYDRSPMSNDGRKVLFHSTSFNTKNNPNKCVEIDIMIFDIDKQETQYISSTKAFNWQQGAKLQWLNDNEIIFNDYSESDDKYISKIYNLADNKFRKIDLPIYDVFEDYALTLNFERLAKLRPDYGYFSKKTLDVNFDLKNEGIIYINLTNNTSSLILSIEDIIKSHYQKNMDDASHLVNHIMISPDGQKFMFLHRWFNGGVRSDALMICDKDGTNLRCISDNEMVSHCFWKSSKEIIGYLRGDNKEDKYYVINVDTNQTSTLDSLNGYGDGHPNINDDLMITDTYPNKSRMKELLTYNFDTKQLKSIGEFYEPFSFYGETRCDLHPRISKDKKYFFIDSVHDGKRNLYMIYND
jgi:hypothetical protein